MWSVIEMVQARQADSGRWECFDSLLINLVDLFVFGVKLNGAFCLRRLVIQKQLFVFFAVFTVLRG
jgi:hypothetical protein